MGTEKQCAGHVVGEEDAIGRQEEEIGGRKSERANAESPAVEC